MVPLNHPMGKIFGTLIADEQQIYDLRALR
jgi:hypothetical protein